MPASPLVLLAYGRRVPLRGVVFTALIFLGIVLVNVGQVEAADWGVILLGGLPVMVAAFAYPTVLQMVWEARHMGTREPSSIAKTTSMLGRWMPAIENEVVDQPFGRVLLLVLGSLPWWIVLVAVTQPLPPSQGQLVNTLLVALLSGVVATVLFMQARHWARSSYELAAVDSTQSTEVIWSVLGEVLLLGGAMPGVWGIAGIGLTLAGLVLFLFAQGKVKNTSILND